jgi:hypothetical protein
MRVPSARRAYWAVLTPELQDDLHHAVRHGQSVASVLARHGVKRMSYYRWLWVGSGRWRTWGDGTHISTYDRKRYAAFALLLAEARLERAHDEVQRLRATAGR